MYDKYLQANPITANSKIPKHKGILISANAPTSITFNMFNASGGTLSTGLTFAAGQSILPISLHSIVSFPAGVTAFYLN